MRSASGVNVAREWVITHLVLGMTVSVVCIPAQAQSESGSGLEEIIVTAQRRDESLSETPVSVAVLTSRSLAEAQVITEQDLRVATPGLSVRATTSSNQLNYALRGQSKDAFSGTRPGVLPYINEVQIAGSAATAFYDLASVQVVKGPQGTLFGRSATGGAVLLTTTKPEEDFGGYFSALAGDYAAKKFEGAINVPFMKEGNGAFRLAGFYRERDGFQDNRFDGSTEGDLKTYGVRLSLSVTIADRIHNDLVYDYFHSDSENTNAVISGLLPFTGTPGQPPFLPMALLYSGTATPIASATGIGTMAALITPGFLPPGVSPATATPQQLAAAGAAAQGAASVLYPAYFSDPNHPSEGLSTYTNEAIKSPYDASWDSSNIYEAKNHIVTNTTRFDMGDAGYVKNIFGFVSLKSLLALDADGTPYQISQAASRLGPNAHRGLAEEIRQVSNEIQLGGKLFDSKLDYVTGIYYSDEESETTHFSTFFDILSPTPVLGGATQLNHYIISSETYAGFAHGTYALNDSLSVNAGVRYTSEKAGKEIRPDDIFRAQLGNPAPPGFSYDQDETYNRWSWQIGISDQINDSLLVYAVTRRAFKSGGFNSTVAPRIGTAEIAGDTYLDERVTDVELGAKYAGTLGGMPARANVAVFNTWMNDSQRTAYSLILNAPASLTVNVPKGRTRGVELDGIIEPVRWLSLGGTFNYLDAKYTDGDVIANGAPQEFDIVPDTPEYSGTLFATFTVPLTPTLDLKLHGEGYGQSKTFTTPRSANSFGTRVDGYELANFRVGLVATEAGWSVTANLKNAFDKTYFVGGLPTGEIYQVNTMVPGEPRTFTLEARYDF